MKQVKQCKDPLGEKDKNLWLELQVLYVRQGRRDWGEEPLLVCMGEGELGTDQVLIWVRL